MDTNTLALAKVVVNKKLNMYRLLVTFDTANYKVTALNAAFKSGDLVSVNANPEYIKAQINRALTQAQMQLRTNNIVLVD